ncbi:MAG: hypothetical protein SFV81_26740 [Pirellulaceae bacterium]|nr:hypothetical protein [Pirellulaceae bacterium]
MLDAFRYQDAMLTHSAARASQFDIPTSSIQNGISKLSADYLTITANMRLPRSTKFDSSQRPTSAGRVCLYWLLCVCVWRGPIPVVHDHSLDIAALANNSHLAEHALAYHADCLGHAHDDDSGLHFHFMLLDHSSGALLPSGASLADSSCSGQADLGVADSLLRIEQQLRFDLDREITQSQIAQGDQLSFTQGLRFSSTADASFLQTQLSNAPALAVLCVCQC